MITEVIKRGHRKGYDENGNLVYKILITDESPVVEIQEEVQDEEEAEEAAPTFPFTVGE
jgi:hypothetical protein